jgi:predicted nucleotidyltransferase
VVAQFAESVEAVPGLAAGIYVGGSLARGDYHSGVSDVDAVALVDRALTATTRGRLAEIHQRLAREVQDGTALHCVYVPRKDASVVSRKHWTWAFDEFFRRPLSGIARAELLADPVIVTGPPPSSWLPPMGHEELCQAARAELAGYWTRALRQRNIWREDVYVDIGLTVWARAEAAIGEGVLITKSEAINRMARRGVLPDIVEGVARRRRGGHVELTEEERRQRADLVREFLTSELERLLAPRDF